MQNKELARKIIKRLNDVRQHKGIKNFSLLKLFSAALKEQGIQMKNLIPEKQTGEEVTFQSGELNLKGVVFRNGHSANELWDYTAILQPKNQWPT
jgi:hypothetical protein